MGALPLQKQQFYTYADYAKWDLKEGERYELIDGVPYAMAAPLLKHQAIIGEVFVQLRDFLNGKSCRPFISPIDVCLFGKGDFEETIVQPDVIVVCDKNKIKNKKYCNGAPDLAVEVLSPSSRKRDEQLKYKNYEFAGVREYWIIDPESVTVKACVLVNGKYKVTEYDGEAIVPVTILDGCKINMKEVFAE